MRGESWIVDVPPDVHAWFECSEQDSALESERLESLISTLRQRAMRREPASTRAASESPRRSAREVLAESPA